MDELGKSPQTKGALVMFFNTDKSRRMNFNGVAASYDQGRPGYPEAMFADLKKFGALPDPAEPRLPSCLEVGSGSGQATIQLLPYCQSVDCIEPGPELADMLAAKFHGNSRISVHQCDFESFPLRQRYSLVFAASSLHWIDPDVAFGKSFDALVKGGWLVAVWNTPLLSKRISEICEQTIRPYDSGFSIPKPSQDVVDFFEQGYDDFANNRSFVDCRKRAYQERHGLSPEGLANLAWSYADSSVVPSERRQSVFDTLLSGVSSLRIDDMSVVYNYMMACGRSPGNDQEYTQPQAENP